MVHQKSRLRGGLALAVVALALSMSISFSALAEDGPAADPAPPAPAGAEAPPDFPQGADAFLAPVERPDLIAYVRKLEQAVSQYRDPPWSTPEVTALRDAWNAILKPRAASMSRRLEKWTDPERWLYVPGEATPVGLKPDQWTLFTRDMATLVSQMAGAHKQYGTVKLKPKERTAGRAFWSRPARLTPYGYGWAVHYGGIADRQRAGRVLGRHHANSYWHLLNRFDYAWDWRWQRRLWWEERWRNRVRATEELFEDLRGQLNATRDAIGENLLATQALVAALQNAEEERLVGECIPCKTKDVTLTEMAETALAAMLEVRLDAERYQGRSSSGYGSLLRKWLRSQKAANKVLEIAREEEEAAEQEPSEEE